MVFKLLRIEFYYEFYVQVIFDCSKKLFMAKLVNLVKTLRNNWKKTVFGTSLLYYGCNYGIDYYNVQQKMRVYCEKASKFGDESISPVMEPRRITVILNPAANKKKAQKMFDKYCAPLLYLSGVYVDILVTESAGQARNLVEQINPNTDAVLVAGGDGTLSEVVTGLMRLTSEKCNLAVGVLPLGKTNSLALSLLGFNAKDVAEVTPEYLAEATMAVILGSTKTMHSLKIEVLEEEQQKPVYGLSSIEWGTWRDAKSKKDQYWYYGPLRNYVSYLFNGPTPAYQGKIIYTNPCSGCSRCFSSRTDLHKQKVEQRWWHAFIRKTRQNNEPEIDYSKIHNENCGLCTEKDLNTVDLTILTPNINPGSIAVDVSIGPKNVSWSDYVMEGWRREKGNKTEPVEKLVAQHIEIKPNVEDVNLERWISIDNEDYEVKPIRATLLYNSLKMFYRNVTEYS